MKRFLLVILTCLVASVSAAAAGGPTVMKDFEVGDFLVLNCLVPAEITYESSDKPYFKVSGLKKLVDNLSVECEGKVLTIKLKDNKINFNKKNLHINIASSSLTNLKVSGTAAVTLVAGLQAEELNVVLDGAGRIEIYDFTAENDVNLRLNGAGVIQVEEIDCENLKLNVNGAGDVSVSGIDCNDVKAVMNGAGDIYLDGKVQNADVAINGAGGINIESLEVVRNLNSSINGIGRIYRR